MAASCLRMQKNHQQVMDHQASDRCALLAVIVRLARPGI